MGNRTNTIIKSGFYSNQIQPELIHIKIHGPLKDSWELLEEFIASKQNEQIILVLAFDELSYIKKK